MKFTDEDGILTANQAIQRSLNGTEDSLKRESIRTAMGYIKRCSLYGYMETSVYGIPQRCSLLENPDIKTLFEGWGYTIVEYLDTGKLPYIDGTPKPNTYSWYIRW